MEILMDATQKSMTEQEVRTAELSLAVEMYRAIRNSEPGKKMKPDEVLDTMFALRLQKA
jgi:hypothetical protein